MILVTLFFFLVFPQSKAAFLDVTLRVKLEDDFCGAQRCNVSYALSILTAQNQFDLQSVMLQEGAITRDEERALFEDSTAIRLPDDLPADPKLYLDYMIVDVSDVIRKPDRRAKVEFASESMRMRMSVYKRSEPEAEVGEMKGCLCNGRECSCCRHLRVRKIRLDDEVCVNMTFIPDHLGFRTTLSIGDRIFINKEISVTESARLCFEVPHLREYASLCLKVDNFAHEKRSVSACAELEARLYHVSIAHKRLGCLRVPLR